MSRGKKILAILGIAGSLLGAGAAAAASAGASVTHVYYNG